MNKIALTFCAVLFSAQVFAQQGIELGFRLSPQIVSQLNQDELDAGDEINYELTTGMAFGLSAAYNFTDNMGAGLNILLSTQGQKFIDESSDPSFKSRRKYSYLKIPLLFHYNSNPEASATFSIETGPQFGFLTSAAIVDEDGDEFDFGVETTELYNSMDLAWVLALGTDISVADNLQLVVKLRLDGSLSDVENKDLEVSGVNFWEFAGEPDRASSQNVTAGLMLGLNYIIGN